MTHNVCGSCKNTWLFNGETMCDSCKNKMIAIMEIGKIAKNHGDIEMIACDIAEIMTKNNLKLNDQQIKLVCDIYYKNGEQTSERLTNSDNLFLQLHHTNEMVI